MLFRSGMSDLGPVSLEAGNQEVFLGRDLMTRSDLSDAVAAKIDLAVRQIVFSCYQETKSLVDQHRECMDRLVDVLIEKETLNGDEFRAIVSEFALIPAKDRFAPILQSQASTDGKTAGVSTPSAGSLEPTA